MDRDSAIAIVKQGLGFRTDLDDEIIAAMQEAQAELEGNNTLPWFLIEEDATIATVANTATVSIPTGFIKEVETEGFRYTDDNDSTVYVRKRSFEQGVEAYFDSDAAGPKIYTLRKDTFYFFPTPDKVYTLTYSYYKADDILTSNIENSWLANIPYLIIGKAGMLVAEDIRNEVAFAKFQRMAARWDRWLDGRIAERELAGNSIALGEDR